MLKTTPKNLMAEIENAISFRDRHMEGYEEKVARYTGPFYDRQGDFTAEYSPENTYYEYISLMVPRLVFDNPRVQVESRRPNAQKDVAEALRHGMNRWSRDANLRGMLVELASDMLLGFGVCLVRPDHRGQTSPTSTPFKPAETPKWPSCERIPPRRFFVDPDAERFKSARFVGHTWKMDKDDLLDLGEGDRTGKPTGQDIRERKMTLPLIHTLAKATPSERRRLIRLVKHHSDDPKAVQEVMNAILQGPGMDRARGEMRRLKEESLALLDELGGSQAVSQEARAALRDLIEYTIRRVK